MTRFLAVLAPVLLLASCRPAVLPVVSEPVEFEVSVPVREPLPDALTDPIDASMCKVEGPTVGDVRRQRAAACTAIKLANDRLRINRELRTED